MPPNLSLELTGLSWSFAGFVGVATEVGEREPAAWVDAFAAAGTPDQVIAAINRLAEAGADSIVFQPLDGDPDCLDEYIQYLMPRLKQG
ncbi:MAG: hypothetical protein JW908_06070 [Anaerolineales bacterium]|nr:hypothetical protein [Anaerolineales bacterium]